MCTSISINSNGFYFGRTLDIECSFGEKVVITPRSYPFKFRLDKKDNSHLSMIGMAAVADNYPLYADAMNEKGLCMAGLKFPDNAVYSRCTDLTRHNISPFELIPWVLSQCETADEARALLKHTNITAVPFSSSLPLAPLHWHIADKNGSFVLESTADGIKLYDDPAGVMTNNPEFDFHMTNLSQYLNISPLYPKNRFGTELEPFSNGFGGIGLPGDHSSCSRFVRAAFLRANSVCEKGEEISHFFRIAENVSLPKGSVLTKENQLDFTLYTCCMDAERSVYYCRTYSDSRIFAVSLKNADGTALSCFELNRSEDIRFAN